MIKSDDLAKSSRLIETGGGGSVKQAADLYTRDLIDKPRRGRPRKVDALTPAQRAQRYRDNLKADRRRAASLAYGREMAARERIRSMERIADAWGAVERHFSADTPFAGDGP